MAQSNTVRTFIATIPEAGIAESLVDLCHTIKTEGPKDSIHWIISCNFHITVRFLGNLTTGQLDQLPVLLASKMVGYQPCELSFDRLCWFPSDKYPRVLAAIFKPCPEFHAIALRTEIAARELGLTPERRSFRPHLSLATIRRKSKSPFTVNRSLANLKMPVNELITFKSELTSSGPIYTRLNSLALEKK